MLTTGFTFVSRGNMAEFRPYTQRRELAKIFFPMLKTIS